MVVKSANTDIPPIGFCIIFLLGFEYAGLSSNFESINLYKNPLITKHGLYYLEECVVNNKSLSGAFLAVILMCGLILVSAMRFGTVQASTVTVAYPNPLSQNSL